MKNEIGYYTVEKKTYSNKLNAVLAAQQTNSEIKWNFFDEVFSKVNWFDEPMTSLDELYRIRAQQIRDAYDYVIVFCSGGSDSNNVIRTFINNNIHVDEVIGIAPVSGLKNWVYDPSNLSEDNTISETKFALFPILQEVSTMSPNTKVTLNDFFENIINHTDDHWTFDSCGNVVTVLTSQFTDILKYKHIDKLVQQGKRIGLVYGTDKPVIRITQDGSLNIAIVDAAINYLNMPTDRGHPNIDRVLFYWTPDLPEILVKQAHVVARAIQIPEFKYVKDSLYVDEKYLIQATASFQQRINYQIKNNLSISTKSDILDSFLNTRNISKRELKFSSRSVYERYIAPFIYPNTYSKSLFQCQKIDATLGFFTRDQDWLHQLHFGSKISGLVLSGTKTLYDSISTNYLNINGTGFLNYYKAYNFGKINICDSN